MPVEEQDGYTIECRLCKGSGTVRDLPGDPQNPSPQVLEIIKSGRDPRVDKVCPACGGVGKLTAYKSLDELAKVLYKKSRSNLIVTMMNTVLIGTGKTTCGACGKEKEVVRTVRISTVSKAGEYHEEQVVTLQLCDKCSEKYDISEDKICRGQKEGSAIVLAKEGDVQAIADDNKKILRGG